ncbi:hypothetical protein EIP91_001224 [Steccherinum ochraceum]|uniref:Ras GEF n=1 Tax=Steccherinum ochraceum TaxID=92696 RepID=A0A4R0RVW7_9APHY|nr:hypothetical protein EIP91_001224 [Steccherinum ochraceum]
MAPTRLRIDTSVGAIAGPSSAVINGSAEERVLSFSILLHFQSLPCTSQNGVLGHDPVYRRHTGEGQRNALCVPSLESLGPQHWGQPHGIPSEYVLAMHDFAPQQGSTTCLSFRAGQVIHVLNRDSSGWWDGELDGRRGWFPSNYVTSDVGLLTEEELPQASQRPRNGNGHMHTASHSSSTSWTSTKSPRRSNSFSRTDHRPMAADSAAADYSYCPPLMVQLLQGISLLQNAVRANRTTHFQPSAACILSAVRTILSDLGCRARNAPVLQQYPILTRERKRILSDLASLVSQARKASEPELDNDAREVEVEKMVRLGGQLFAHVRGFLAVAVQCGVSVQSTHQQSGSEYGSTDTEGRWDSQEGTLVRSDGTSTPAPDDYGPYWESVGAVRTTNGISHRSRRRDREPTATPVRSKSLVDLRNKKRLDEGNIPAMPDIANGGYKQSWSAVTPTARRLTSGHKVAQSSVSSISSSSSLSSGESIGTPPTPLFPTGSSTTNEVMDALRHTHDHYLSTIAAFIGHAHSHSRSSHASSTGHMYDLVREVVEMVCKLLTIVEAVLRHPDIPHAKAQDLRSAKANLYNVTSTLADAVRMLTTAPATDISEEDEKASLLRSATNALKAGSDCVNAVKKCLQRSTGERPFIIELPNAGEIDPSSYTPSKFSHYGGGKAVRIRDASSLHALREMYRANGIDAEDDEQDLTIQAQTPSFADTTMKIPRQSMERVDEIRSASPLPASTPVSATSEDQKTPSLRTSEDSQSQRPGSPVSFAPTDDGTTWEGSLRHHGAQSMEEKLLNGDLPAVPEMSAVSFGQADLSTYILSHDHAPDDVAYNGEGQLVGATLEALVERMTPHDSLVEPPFAAVFFMTFRQFVTPEELIDSLIARYNIMPPDNIPREDQYIWQQRKGLPVRLRVSNFIKSWLESYWRPNVDNVILPTLHKFTSEALSMMFPVPSQRILELVRQWQAASEAGITPKVDRVRDAGIPLNPPTVPPSEIPRPIMTKTLLSLLRSKNFAGISVTDFDPLELARQMTFMECTLYCAILPEEVLETGKPGNLGNVKAVTTLSTVVTGWVAESILNEPDTKKRTNLVKFFIKLADRCTSLQNFSTSRSILAALDSSTISRLHQTWSGLPQKNRMQLDTIRKLADHARNYHEYRSRLRNTAPPAVPFLGLYLTDVTFCREGNPSHRASPKNPEKKLLNFNKYHKLARIVQDMQRFQVPYNLKEIPEVQDYLKDAFEQSKHRGDLQDLYRRSLLVEPKRPADTPPTTDMRQLFGWARSQSQQPTPTSAS